MVSDEQLLDDLQEFADELGETPTYTEMNNSGPWSSKTYENHFGTWVNSIEKANLDKNKKGVEPTDDEEIIQDIIKFSKEIGKVPTQREMNSKGPWSHHHIANRFGSWNNGLELAGLEKNRIKDVSEEKLLQDLKKFSNKLGKTPSCPEMQKSGPYTPSTYRRRFGSWNKALQLADLEINVEKNEERPSEKSIEYGEGYIEAREKALERDGKKCRICDKDGLLHCHHIKPRRTFDDVSESNTPDNLVILCPSCHGKYEGQWQHATPDEFVAKAKR